MRILKIKTLVFGILLFVGMQSCKDCEDNSTNEIKPTEECGCPNDEEYYCDLDSCKCIDTNQYSNGYNCRDIKLNYHYLTSLVGTCGCLDEKLIETRCVATDSTTQGGEISFHYLKNPAPGMSGMESIVSSKGYYFYPDGDSVYVPYVPFECDLYFNTGILYCKYSDDHDSLDMMIRWLEYRDSWYYPTGDTCWAKFISGRLK